MLKERYAFEFHESIFSKHEINQLSKTENREIKRVNIDLDMIYRVIDRATTLSGCVGALCNCFVESQKTKEVAKRIHIAKKVLDNLVEEEATRAEVEIKEFMERNEAKIKNMEKNLKLSKVEITKLAELERKKFDNFYEVDKMKKDIIIKQRRQIKELLDTVSEILDSTYKVVENKNDKRILQVNERYKDCLRDYKDMIKIGR